MPVLQRNIAKWFSKKLNAYRVEIMTGSYFYNLTTITNFNSLNIKKIRRDYCFYGLITVAASLITNIE